MMYSAKQMSEKIRDSRCGCGECEKCMAKDKSVEMRRADQEDDKEDGHVLPDGKMAKCPTCGHLGATKPGAPHKPSLG
jgi:hypothetical protein